MLRPTDAQFQTLTVELGHPDALDRSDGVLAPGRPRTSFFLVKKRVPFLGAVPQSCPASTAAGRTCARTASAAAAASASTADGSSGARSAAAAPSASTAERRISARSVAAAASASTAARSSSARTTHSHKTPHNFPKFTLQHSSYTQAVYTTQPASHQPR